MINICYTILILIALSFLDDIFKYNYDIRHDNQRWCLIHTIINLFVVIFSLNGMITLLSSDLYQNSAQGFTILSTIIVMAAHIHHLLNYRINELSLLMHHYIMMSILVIPYFNTDNMVFLYFTDYSLFFMCGLPGMIDYFCMYLCYANLMDKMTEKYINNILNTYIRSPGILYGAFYAHRMWINGMVAWYYSFPIIIAFLWNAQFFSNCVAISYGYNLRASKK